MIWWAPNTHHIVTNTFCRENFFFGKIFITLFSGTLRPTKLKLSTHVVSGWMYRVCQNQAFAAYSSLHFFVFLSLQFSNIKIFCHFFLRNWYVYKFETRYISGQWVDVLWVPESGCCCFFHPFISSFFFLSNFQTLKFFVTLFSGMVKPWQLDNIHRVYQNQTASAYSSLSSFFCLFNISKH